MLVMFLYISIPGIKFRSFLNSRFWYVSKTECINKQSKKLHGNVLLQAMVKILILIPEAL
jgi:hypothetical protein